MATAFAVHRYGDRCTSTRPLGAVALAAVPRFPEPDSAVAQGSLLAPMPGSVIRLGAGLGDTVTAGQPLVWLEAMKMEHTITAPADGVLTELDVRSASRSRWAPSSPAWNQRRTPRPTEGPGHEGRQMTDTSFIETAERQALRKAVAALAANYGPEYYLERARAGGHTDELWREAGQLGFIGVNLPEEYGGGGAGMYELALVMEELAAGGCPLLMMVVSPAINGTIIAKFGTEEQKHALGARYRRRLDHHGVRHHRTRRRLELTPDHHHRAP